MPTGQNDVTEIRKWLTVYSTGASVAELAVFMDQSPGTVRAKLYRMESQNMVSRIPDPMNPMHAVLWVLPTLTPAPTAHVPVQKLRGRTR